MDTTDSDRLSEDLSMDRPRAAELLEIVAATLSESVLPATAPHAQHQVRVAANLCRIVQRQIEAVPADSMAGPDGVLGDLPASLLDVDDETARRAHVAVTELVRAKLAINKPGYDSHGVDEERSIVA